MTLKKCMLSGSVKNVMSVSIKKTSVTSNEATIS